MIEAERQTRKRRIDMRLRALGWKIAPHRPSMDTSKLEAVALEEYPTVNGPADYALFVRGKLLGIIEAKKVTVNPQNVLEQAKRYALGAADGPGLWDGYRVPFLYASNGELVWHLDTRSHKRISRQLSGFHTATALAEMYKRSSQEGFDWFLNNPIERITRAAPLPAAIDLRGRESDHGWAAFDVVGSGHRHGQDLSDGGNDLSPFGVGGGEADSLPCGSEGTGGTGSA